MSPVVTASHPHLVAFEAAVAKGMSEKTWLGHVITLLLWCGFPRNLIYHTRDSRGSQPGFPDLIALRYRAGRWTVLVVELKTVRGKTTADQQRWLTNLGAIAALVNGMTQGVRIVVDTWRPSDRHRILELLRNDYPKE